MELADKVAVVTGGARASAGRWPALRRGGRARRRRRRPRRAGAQARGRRARRARARPSPATSPTRRRSIGADRARRGGLRPDRPVLRQRRRRRRRRLETTDEDWDLAWASTSRPLYAAQALLPGLARARRGLLLTTASAAGLLTQIGAAPYAVTKHAAVAFAEWLSITYGDRGVGVSCLCPMGVDTHARSPTTARGPAAGRPTSSRRRATCSSPSRSPTSSSTALREERFLILPHPEVLKFFQRKAADYDRWLAGMRRLQARVAAQRRGRGRRRRTS